MGIEVIGSEEQPLSWLQFQVEIEKEIEAARKEDPTRWIYRGHSDSKWGLLTSLERYIQDELIPLKEQLSLQDYYHNYLSPIIPQLNAQLGRNFERLKSVSLKSADFILGFSDLPYYNLLCYARHLGFPTPLLDWSASYYIAAFFAFRHVKPGANVAIWSYRSRYIQERFVPDNLLIHELDPLVEAHTRHFRQQGTYTICGEFKEKEIDLQGLRLQIENIKSESFMLVEHEKAIKSNPKTQVIKKFILNGAEKINILKHLYMMNINDYTLFGDEEALIRALAFKVFQDV